MATVTIFANTNDVSLQAHDPVCAGLQTAPTTFDVFTGMAVGQHFQSPDVYAWEAFLEFDTSQVLAASSGELTIRINDPIHGLTEFDVEARKYDFGATVTSADWVPSASIGALPLMASANTLPIDTANELFTLTETGGSFVNNITYGGTTRIMLVSSLYRTGPCAATDQSFTFFGTAQAGTVDDPRITIVTTPGAASGDTLYPGADNVINGWTTNTGATDFIYTAIDEVSVSDADYIQSPAAPTSSQYYETLLQTHGDPLSSTGHVVRYRYQKNIAGANVNLTAELLQGGTSIASWAHTNIGNAWVTQTQTLTGPQADSITNYADLRLKFTPSLVTSEVVPTKVADRANVNGNTAVSTVDLVLASMTVGNWLIIRTAADNSGGSGAARTVTVTNQSGTPIDTATDLAYQRNNDPGAASVGVTLNVFVCKITATSGTVRLTYSGTVVQAAQAEEWSGLDPTNPVVGTPVAADGVASTNLASMTDSIALGNVAYGAIAIEGPNADTFTQDADSTGGTWTSLTKRGTTNATADTNQTIVGGYKVVTVAGNQTYNPTNSVARDSAGLLLELAAAPSTVRTQVSWANFELPVSTPPTQSPFSHGAQVAGWWAATTTAYGAGDI